MFHKTIILTIVAFNENIQKYSFNLLCLNNFWKSVDIDDLVVNFIFRFGPLAKSLQLSRMVTDADDDDDDT